MKSESEVQTNQIIEVSYWGRGMCVTVGVASGAVGVVLCWTGVGALPGEILISSCLTLISHGISAEDSEINFYTCALETGKAVVFTVATSGLMTLISNPQYMVTVVEKANKMIPSGVRKAAQFVGKKSADAASSILKVFSKTKPYIVTNKFANVARGVRASLKTLIKGAASVAKSAKTYLSTVPRAAEVAGKIVDVSAIVASGAKKITLYLCQKGAQNATSVLIGKSVSVGVDYAFNKMQSKEKYDEWAKKNFTQEALGKELNGAMRFVLINVATGGIVDAGKSSFASKNGVTYLKLKRFFESSDSVRIISRGIDTGLQAAFRTGLSSVANDLHYNWSQSENPDETTKKLSGNEILARSMGNAAVAGIYQGFQGSVAKKRALQPLRAEVAYRESLKRENERFEEEMNNNERYREIHELNKGVEVSDELQKIYDDAKHTNVIIEKQLGISDRSPDFSEKIAKSDQSDTYYQNSILMKKLRGMLAGYGDVNRAFNGFSRKNPEIRRVYERLLFKHRAHLKKIATTFEGTVDIETHAKGRYPKNLTEQGKRTYMALQYENNRNKVMEPHLSELLQYFPPTTSSKNRDEFYKEVAPYFGQPNQSFILEEIRRKKMENELNKRNKEKLSSLMKKIKKNLDNLGKVTQEEKDQIQKASARYNQNKKKPVDTREDFDSQHNELHLLFSMRHACLVLNESEAGCFSDENDLSYLEENQYSPDCHLELQEQVDGSCEILSDQYDRGMEFSKM